MIEKFKLDGFLYNKNLVKKDKIKTISNTFIKTLNYLLKKNYNFANGFDNKTITKTIIDLKKRNSKKIEFIYSSLVHYSSFINLFETKEIRNIAAQILNTDPNTLIIAEHQFRIDYPNDLNHILDWHQDSSYYPQDEKGENSLVCNISLHKISKDMGMAIVLPKSQTQKKLKFKITKGSKFKSGQRKINDKIMNYIPKILNTNPGDVTFYHSNLIHKSGFNKSKKIRFSAIARIFNPLSKHYRYFNKMTKIL